MNRSGVGAYGQITQTMGTYSFRQYRFSKKTKYYWQILILVKKCKNYQKISWFWLNFNHFPEFCPEKRIFHTFRVLKIIYPCTGLPCTRPHSETWTGIVISSHRCSPLGQPLEPDMGRFV